MAFSTTPSLLDRYENEDGSLSLSRYRVGDHTRYWLRRDVGCIFLDDSQLKELLELLEFFYSEVDK